jgi:decaprenylphospho-beta-D-erythro-pentofuranosid-2-ulose 2-reductase
VALVHAPCHGLLQTEAIAGDRGRKSKYSMARPRALNIFLDGLNRIDRPGVEVLTIRQGFVAASMTAHVSGNALFAAPNTIARGIVKAIDRGKDVVNLLPLGGPIMLIIRSIPQPFFKRLEHVGICVLLPISQEATCNDVRT